MPYNPNSPLGDVIMNPTPKPSIEIIIKRSSHDCGSTTVAAIIAGALKKAGMKHVEVQCKDGDFHAVASGAINHPSETIISQKVCETNILIRDENEYIGKPPQGINPKY